MSEIPHELIRQVQICTRAGAGLPNYDPSDPTLPALPSISAAIAAFDPSPPHLRCKNCKGRLLRGSESIICVYCGRGPQEDVVLDPICFTSTTGYQWLLRSLRLDGSEMVELPNKAEQDQGQNSRKALIPLSDFLNFKIPWPVEPEKQETSVSDKHSEENKRSLSLTGVAPDNFFFKSTRDVLNDKSIEQPFMHNQIESAVTKDTATLDNQNLFQNVKSSEPAGSSSKYKTTEAFSDWEANFQFADSENQHDGHESSNHFTGSLANSGNEVQALQSFDSSTGLEVDLAAHIDSVFGPGKDLKDGKTNEKITASPAFDDWNSDDLWNNLSSNDTHFAGGFDTSVGPKDDHEGDHKLEYSDDLSTSADLFQDFQLQTSNVDMSEETATNEDHKTIDEDSFEEWNDFTGSTGVQVPSKNAWTGSDYQVSISDKKSSEIDLFSSEDKFEERDFGGFSQPNIFSTSTSNSNDVAEVNTILSENLASNWISDASSSSNQSGQAAYNGDASGKSTEAKDDVMMLISQMHDLSFMLESDLCIPSSSDARSSSPKD